MTQHSPTGYFCPRCNCRPCVCQPQPNMTMQWCNRCNRYHEVHPFSCYMEFNYECPFCKGKFNNPTIRGSSTLSLPTSHCPFCNYQMEGLS